MCQYYTVIVIVKYVLILLGRSLYIMFRMWQVYALLMAMMTVLTIGPFTVGHFQLYLDKHVLVIVHTSNRHDRTLQTFSMHKTNARRIRTVCNRAATCHIFFLVHTNSVEDAHGVQLIDVHFEVMYGKNSNIDNRVLFIYSSSECVECFDLHNFQSFVVSNHGVQ